MSARVLFLLGVALAFASVALLGGESWAGEPEDVEQVRTMGDADGSVPCTGWMNCAPESPNYTGYCCRCCRYAEGGKEWECKRVSAGAEQRDTQMSAKIAEGEATVSGVVTREGILQSDDGPAYAVAGEKAGELRRNVGKKIEVKGTVQEAQGRATIDVKAYELVSSGTVAADQGSRTQGAFASCKGWRNCNPLPPTFTGTCCRECEDEQGRERWDCRVFSPSEYFDLAEWLDE